MRLALVVVAIALSGCTCGTPVEDDPPPPPVVVPDAGALGGRCLNGGLCNDDLVCNFNNTCDLDPGEGEGEGEEGEGEEGEGEGEGEGCDVDADRDGSCEGDDCDDNDGDRFPGNREDCSFVDEDCDGDNNDGLECSFIAHTSDKLFRIDPFAQTAEFERDIDDVNGVLDIDVDEDGDFIVATSAGVFEVRDNGTLASVASVSAVGGRINGVCITGTGTMFLTTDDGVDSAAWKVEGNQTVEVGGFSDGLVSSGDCVVTKQEDVLMSAKDPDNAAADDRLVLVNSATGATNDVGSIGFKKVFGLSASFDFLFGVTADGDVIEIDRETGDGALLFRATDNGAAIRFAGAANGD